MKNKLAIIIPAYKACFFREVLDSIVRQSNRDFTVYIGDDASPDDLESIVSDYKDKLDIFYFRFEQNWGGRDLVAHWERCIELSDEPLVWLFSDDDLMPPDAVERVIKGWKKSGECDAVFRFPLAIVDAYGELKYTNPPFETERISGYDFLLDKLSGKISSAACEYVFTRDVWKKTGGFVRFPLAWCSDDATWAKFADYASGIISLPGTPVYWRNAEDKNISNSTRFDGEKLKATGLFLKWIGMNYRLNLRESRFQDALVTYVNVILKCSVRGNYSLKDLVCLYAILRKFSPTVASRILRSHILKAKLFI